MKYVFNGIEYDLINNEKDAFNLEEIEEKITDYFVDFDYILGDWAYGKVRLKGFYESNNKKAKEMNDIKNKDTYLEENCAYGCKWFLLKKVISKEKTNQ